jgi:hypothetical protein
MVGNYKQQRYLYRYNDHIKFHEEFHRPVLCAEELLIILINFMKKMKSEQSVLPDPCLEEEEEEEEEEEFR